MTSGPDTWEFDQRSRLALDEIALPLRVEHVVPGLPMLGIELGAQAEYVLRAVQDNRSDPDPAPTIAERRGVPAARIFEVMGTFGGERELTFATRRLGSAASAGMAWHTRAFSHEAAVVARYERGLTGLWTEGAERFASRAGVSLRVAW